MNSTHLPKIAANCPPAQKVLATYPAGLNADLAAACALHGVTAAQISRRYSDCYIVSASRAQLAAIKDAGIWRSMAELTRMNPDHPEAKATPYLLDVPFAFLSAAMEARKAGRE